MEKAVVLILWEPLLIIKADKDEEYSELFHPDVWKDVTLYHINPMDQR